MTTTTMTAADQPNLHSPRSTQARTKTDTEGRVAGATPTGPPLAPPDFVRQLLLSGAACSRSRHLSTQWFLNGLPIPFLGVAFTYTRLFVLRSHLSVVGNIREPFDLQIIDLGSILFRYVKQCNLRPLISSQCAVLT